MTKKQSIQKKLDTVYPTLVRYLGMLVLAYAVVFDGGKNPALIPAGTALIFFKSVIGRDENGNGNGKTKGT